MQEASELTALEPNAAVLRPLTLRTNFSWSLLGNVVYSGCQWALLIVLSKLLTPEQVGLYGLGLAVAAPVNFCASLHLGVVLATDAKNEFRFADYIGLHLLASLIGQLVVLGIALYSYDPRQIAVILCVSLAQAVEMLGVLFYGLYQRHERMDRIAFSQLLKGLLSLLVFALFTWATKDVFWGAFGLLASRLAVFITYDFNIGRMFVGWGVWPRWTPATQWRVLGLGFPMGLVTMMISLHGNVPRYFIERRWGEHDLGIFTALASLMFAGSVIVRALFNTASPRLANYFAAGELGKFRLLLLKLLAIGLAIGIAGIAVAWLGGAPLLRLLYTSEYAAYSSLLIWLMVAAAFQNLGSFFGTAITAMRWFNIQPWSHAVVLVATFGLSAWWVGPYGIEGAGWAVCGSSALATLIGAVLTWIGLARARHSLAPGA